ncbi:unnamed protein product [Effrenium voratum]|nr:unnamed protein product [Effrenium voratum]
MSMPVLSCAFRAGDALGHFKVQQLIGRGSFGIVVSARDARDNRPVALKLVPCDQLDGPSAAVAREAAFAEADLLRGFQHPNIVSCFEVSWDAERASVVMALEYMDGGDIQSVLARRRSSSAGPLPAGFVRSVLGAIGGALCFVHRQGVLHRDVKPGNILLKGSGEEPCVQEIKLADFGIAKLLENTLAAKTVTGTPHYMAPEMVRGQAYAASSDAWALGVCLYEMAALRRPFEANNQLALAKQIVDEPEPPLPEELPADLRSAISGLLTKEPEERLSLEEALQHPEVRTLLNIPSDVRVEELSVANSPRSIISSLPDIPQFTAPPDPSIWWRPRGSGRKVSTTAWCWPDNHVAPKEKKGGSRWFSLFRHRSKVAESPSVSSEDTESTTVVSAFSKESNDSDLAKPRSAKAGRAWK